MPPFLGLTLTGRGHLAYQLILFSVKANSLSVKTRYLFLPLFYANLYANSMISAIAFTLIYANLLKSLR